MTETVDEWATLSEAIGELGMIDPSDEDLGEFDCMSLHFTEQAWAAMDSVVKMVPKLLKAYEELWEMTQSMMRAWEELEKAKATTIQPATLGDLKAIDWTKLRLDRHDLP